MIAPIFDRHVDQGVPAMVLELEQIGALSSCFEQVSGAQLVAREQLGRMAGVPHSTQKRP